MMKKTCPNCHSARIIPNADAVETENLAIRIYERPGVALKGVRHYALKAWVCADCGYTQLYVNQPAELAASYQRYLGKV
jgi:predicted nucleic-acid-binding Zn-ribbon protein